MSRARLGALAAWSARDLWRRPGETFLIFIVLILVTFTAALPPLLFQALSDTAQALLDAGPSLVVRRIGPAGWMPMPEAEGVAAARSVRGATEVRPRIWGVAASLQGPLTAVALDEKSAAALATRSGQAMLAAGQAIVGPGIDAAPGGRLELAAATRREFTVTAKLDVSDSMAAHDLVFLRPEEARVLLGLEEGQASDLAVNVFHDEEETAIQPDLEAAFPFPVRIAARRDAAGELKARLARDGGLWMLALVPAALALALLALTAGRGRHEGRREAALLKAFGWTHGDLVRLELLRALTPAAPAVLLGLASAYLLIVWPGVSWPAELLFNWMSLPPRLDLQPANSLLVFGSVGAGVLSPWLAATLWRAAKLAAADPADWLADEGGLA
ncbi:MAG: ABC transporter permease [Myxococcales bacterium]|nr:MAG: ABC transporter permease [Myxococcales bacterium]